MEKKLNIILGLLAVLIVLMVISLIPNLSGLKSDAAMRGGQMTLGNPSVISPHAGITSFVVSEWPATSASSYVVSARISVDMTGRTSTGHLCRFTVDWGDGTPTVTSSAQTCFSSLTPIARHSYVNAGAGTYNVHVSVSPAPDDGLAPLEASRTVTVPQ